MAYLKCIGLNSKIIVKLVWIGNEKDRSLRQSDWTSLEILNCSSLQNIIRNPTQVGPPCSLNVLQMAILIIYLGILQISQSEVKSCHIIKNFWWNISFNFLLEDTGCRAISWERPLYIRLFQNLCKFYPCLHIIWKLLCYLL